jgi:replication-associated recombination protein RarA
MKEWGYGEGYEHAHKFEDAITDMECLPPSLAGRRYYPHRSRRGEAHRGAAGESRLDISCRVTSAAPPAPPLVLTS